MKLCLHRTGMIKLYTFIDLHTKSNKLVMKARISVMARIISIKAIIMDIRIK